MDRVPSYMLASLGVVLTVATVLMGFAVPAMWTMAADVGAIKARVELFDKRFEMIDRRFDTLEVKIDAIGLMRSTYGWRHATAILPR